MVSKTTAKMQLASIIQLASKKKTLLVRRVNYHSTAVLLSSFSFGVRDVSFLEHRGGGKQLVTVQSVLRWWIAVEVWETTLVKDKGSKRP